MKIVGKKFTVRMPEDMLAKLSEQLNNNNEVIIRSDDIGFTIVSAKSIIDEIEWSD